jgi:hypothetical protein
MSAILMSTHMIDTPLGGRAKWYEGPSRSQLRAIG